MEKTIKFSMVHLTASMVGGAIPLAILPVVINNLGFFVHMILLVLLIFYLIASFYVMLRKYDLKLNDDMMTLSRTKVKVTYIIKITHYPKHRLVYFKLKDKWGYCAVTLFKDNAKADMESIKEWAGIHNIEVETK